MPYIPADDFTFDDYLRDLFYHVSPAWQHYFLFNQGYDVVRFELLCHCLHYLYNLHPLTFKNVHGGVAKNTVTKSQAKYQKIKCIGILIKVAYGSPDAMPTPEAIKDWERASIHRRIAEDLSAYLVELHSGWKEKQGYKFTATSMLSDSIYNPVMEWRQNSRTLVDMEAVSQLDANGALHYLYFRAINYLFDLRDAREKVVRIVGRAIPEHITGSIKRNDDRMYRLPEEKQKEELARPTLYL